MELEQRVQALEQETQLLKNQIQAVLLDIQEQLLTNAYPSLMADNVSPTRRDGGGPSDPAPSLRSNHVKVFTPETPSDDTPTTSGLSVRQISLDELQYEQAPEPAVRPEPAPARVMERRQPAPAPVPQSANATDWSTLAELEEWACNKVEKMGLDRTQRLIRRYSEKGHITPEIEDALLELVTLYAQQNNMSNGRGGNGRQPQRESQGGRSMQSTRSARPQRTSQPAKSQRSRPAEHFDQPQYSQSAPSKPRKNAQSAVREPAPQPRYDNEADDDSSQNVILRLIAGVQNAGAGVKWSKRHG